MRENGLTYFADLHGGQKTGWYFDQRDNRALVARYAARCRQRARSLLQRAAVSRCRRRKPGRSAIIGVDFSEAALELAQKAAAHNNLAAKCKFHRADVFEDLERRIKVGEAYDVVIADPPAFVKSRKDLTSGARGYRKLAKLAASVTAPTASCSSLHAAIICRLRISPNRLHMDYSKPAASAASSILSSPPRSSRASASAGKRLFEGIAAQAGLAPAYFAKIPRNSAGISTGWRDFSSMSTETVSA